MPRPHKFTTARPQFNTAGEKILWFLIDALVLVTDLKWDGLRTHVRIDNYRLRSDLGINGRSLNLYQNWFSRMVAAVGGTLFSIATMCVCMAAGVCPVFAGVAGIWTYTLNPAVALMLVAVGATAFRILNPVARQAEIAACLAMIIICLFIDFMAAHVGTISKYGGRWTVTQGTSPDEYYEIVRMRNVDFVEVMAIVDKTCGYGSIPRMVSVTLTRTQGAYIGAQQSVDVNDPKSVARAADALCKKDDHDHIRAHIRARTLAAAAEVRRMCE